ncbi:MAG: hypothetical protein GY898_03285 [Proteobacteria bacterium]|nr:hypothetical protein [Pseudomonadota bacterium]
MQDNKHQKRRLVARYVIAASIIPIGVACGVGGLAQNWSRKVRGRPRRTAPQPVGVPDGSGLRKVG